MEEDVVPVQEGFELDFFIDVAIHSMFYCSNVKDGVFVVLVNAGADFRSGHGGVVEGHDAGAFLLALMWPTGGMCGCCDVFLLHNHSIFLRFKKGTPLLYKIPGNAKL